MADQTDVPTFEIPPPHPELRRLDPLLGSWRADDQTEATDVAGPAVRVTSSETFRWLDGGYFLVQEYETVFGDEPAQRGVNYWRYDSDVGRFKIIFFSNNGPFTEDGNLYEGKATGDGLTMVGPARFQYELDDDGRIRLNSGGTVSIEWWLRDRSGKWQHWMRNMFTKV
jgi:hypothetical protein